MTLLWLDDIRDPFKSPWSDNVEALLLDDRINSLYKKMKLTILTGISGSGKSTVTRSLSGENTIIINRSMYSYK